MMAIEGPGMRAETGASDGRIGRIVLLLAATLAAVFGTGVVIGIFAGHARHGGPMSWTLLAIVAGAALIAAGSAFAAWRIMRAMMRAGGGATQREKRNRLVLIACGGLGGAMGLALSLAGPSPMAAFNNDPLPPALAIVLSLFIGLVLPVLSVYWHRRVADEQEAAAYNKGALLGLYSFWIGAPTWWLLWRGGMLPAPDGIIIYMVTILVAGAVWLWAKYR